MHTTIHKQTNKNKRMEIAEYYNNIKFNIVTITITINIYNNNNHIIILPYNISSNNHIYTCGNVVAAAATAGS